MKVYINGRFLSQSITGVQRYAVELIKTIDKMLEKGEINSQRCNFILLAPRKIKPSFVLRNITVKNVGFLNGHLWEQLELPLYSRNGLLMNLCNSAPILKKKKIVTIHDASVFARPENFSTSYRIWYKILLKILCKSAKKIITVSFFSKKELNKYCSITEKNVQVIYLGKEHVLSNNS